MIALILALLVLTIWWVLWLAHAAFWRIDREVVPPPPPAWPPITVVIPARNEAAGIRATLCSLWEQDYPGGLQIIVVDDHSDDGTAEAALQAARENDQEKDLCVLAAEPLPPGWTGKVWAMQQGLTCGPRSGDATPYILFSDADIVHGSGALRELVGRAEAGRCELVSFMVRLHCRSTAEKLMIPAFVFFFKLLYPFRRINHATDPLAGAAGGTLLLRREALLRIGGLASIRGELIDDCALARQVKRGGHRLWIGLSKDSYSTRAYRSLREIVEMIARTAYTQLGYSPLRLLGCVAGLSLTVLGPPLLVLFAPGGAALLGTLAWLLMAGLYLPTVHFYGLSPLWALLLPATALCYLGATVLSAIWRYRGRPRAWRGHRHAPGPTNGKE